MLLLLQCIFCCFTSVAIKNYLPFQSYINDDISDKGFHLIFLSLGLIWYGVVMSLPSSSYTKVTTYGYFLFYSIL